MTSTTTPAIVRWTKRLEESEALDRPVQALEPSIRDTFGTGTRGSLLRGEWLGHAIHPVLTDFLIGSWTSATMLDVFGGKESRAAAQKLVGAGLLAVAPTAWTGWAEWSQTSEQGVRRTGVAHAAANTVALGLYTGSWLARRRGRHGLGVATGHLAAAVVSAGGFLGAHLAIGRKVGTGTAEATGSE